MMETMYTVPTDPDVIKCIVTKEAAEGTGQPELVRVEGGQSKKQMRKHSTKHSAGEIA